MVKDQNEAETKKKEAEVLSKELDTRNASVEKQRKEAESELAQAEPALIDAKQAVRNIKKAHLDELRALNNPPTAVKITLEAVSEMLGLSCGSWKDIRRNLQRKEFIPDVVNFDSERLTESQRTKVSKLLLTPDFDQRR